MNYTNSVSGKPLARLLFLNDPHTDRRTKNFIDVFREAGYELDVLVATPGIDSNEPLTLNDTIVTRLPLPYSSGSNMFFRYDKLLNVYLKTAKHCDILLACDLFSLKAAAKAKQGGKARRLFYDARELYTELPTVAKNPIKKWFWKLWERKGLKQTDIVIVTAPDDAEAIRRVHGFLPPTILVRNLPKREELKPNNYLRDYFSISSDKKIFVYIGGVLRDRGLEKMLDIMPILKDVALIIIGEGAIKETLQQQCNARNLGEAVFFHPSIDSEKVIEVLASADVGISLIEQHSKSYELALPSKIFEYMLAGLPVISSPLKQVMDLFNNTEGILFADPDNKKELLSSCQRAMIMSSDIELKTKIYVEAYNHYTFEIDAQALANFLTPRT